MASEKKIDVAPDKAVDIAVTAPVANATNGKSTVSSFRYYEKMCFATLKNGVSGIVGDTTSCGLRDMIALKGSGIQIQYSAVGVWTDKQGQVHPRFRLEWSLE
jgi:hypothetical protein